MKSSLQTLFLNLDPFQCWYGDRECGRSKDKWGKLYGPPRQRCTGEYHHTKVCKGTLPTSGTNN